jgi:hypothetical protein
VYRGFVDEQPVPRVPRSYIRFSRSLFVTTHIIPNA